MKNYILYKHFQEIGPRLLGHCNYALFCEQGLVFSWFGRVILHSQSWCGLWSPPIVVIDCRDGNRVESDMALSKIKPGFFIHAQTQVESKKYPKMRTWTRFYGFRIGFGYTRNPIFFKIGYGYTQNLKPGPEICGLHRI